jgi:hypothetical protein
MCKRSKESIDHLLHHHKVVKEVWNSLFNLFGVEWVMPRRVIVEEISWDAVAFWKFGK